MARAYKLTDWDEMGPRVKQRRREGWTVTRIAREYGIGLSTLKAWIARQEPSETPEHLGTPEEHQVIAEEHLSTPEPTEILSDEQYTQEHLSTLQDADHTEVHPGTLEGHQEVMEDISQSVPDAPHISTEEVHQSIPEHPSTPEVHPELSQGHSSTVHSGVPARQDHLISTPMVHPGTPTEEDWELWTTIKAMWPRVEKMLS